MDNDKFPHLTPEELGIIEEPEREPIEEPVIVEDAPNEGPRNKYAAWVQGLSEERWKRFQLIAGIVIGLLSSGCLWLSLTETFRQIGFIAALVVAMFAPSTMEKQGGRPMRRCRTVMMITFIISLLLLGAYGFFILPAGYFDAKQ